MMYHSAALADLPVEVDVIAYRGRDLPRSLRERSHIRFHLLSVAPIDPSLSRGPFLVAALLRSLGVCLRVGWTLLAKVSRPEVVLVQNPPSVPTLLVVWIVARIRRAKIVIDWHNFGYSMLALRLGRANPIVRVARWYERVVGSKADEHLCVSNGMRDALRKEWHFQNVHVLYDRPAKFFESRTESQRLATRHRWGLADARDFLIVSATSWTRDEDFELLLNALLSLDHRLSASERVVLLVTGDGPGRAGFERRLEQVSLKRVKVRTGWFDFDDYVDVLASADVGVCLLRSGSGLDLPMKVFDMFGAGLPVLAFDYGHSLRELGADGLRCFVDANELSGLLLNLLREPNDLQRLQEAVLRRSRQTWREGWNEEARAVFEGSSTTGER